MTLELAKFVVGIAKEIKVDVDFPFTFYFTIISGDIFPPSTGLFMIRMEMRRLGKLLDDPVFHPDLFNDMGSGEIKKECLKAMERTILKHFRGNVTGV